MHQQRHAEWLVLNGLEAREQHGPEYEMLFQAAFVLNGLALEPGAIDQSHVALGRTRDYLACSRHKSLLAVGRAWYSAAGSKST